MRFDHQINCPLNVPDVAAARVHENENGWLQMLAIAPKFSAVSYIISPDITDRLKARSLL